MSDSFECNAGIATLRRPMLGTNCPGHNSGSRVLLKNARIVDPYSNLDIECGEIIIEGSVIAGVVDSVSKSDESGFSEVVDCAGMVIAPGLVDIQVHFRDPGQGHKEDMVTGSISAVAGGVTSVVCQPNTSPTLDNGFVLDYLYYKSRMEAYCNVYAYASMTTGLRGEVLTDIQALSAHPVVCGFTDDGLPLADANLMRKCLELSGVTGKVIAQHAEDRSLSQGGCMNEGLTSAKLGVTGIPNVSESVIVERDIALLRAFGGKYHVLHVSTMESVEAIRRAKNDGLAVTCEVSPHHLCLDDSSLDGYNTCAKMNPPLRSREDVACLRKAMVDGVFDAIATDHAPHDTESKERSLADAAFGIVGLETMLPIALEMYHEGSMSLMSVISLMTDRPSRVVGIDAGRILKGGKADLVVFDLNRSWTVRPERFLSKSYNSPFAGREVKGLNVMTFVSGVRVFDAMPG